MASQPSVVELGRYLERVALGLVVVDPQLRLFPGEHVGDALHRGKGLVSVLADGTRRFSQLLLKWTASPESTTAPVLGNLTRSDWWPGVCPGVERIVTLPSPNTS